MNNDVNAHELETIINSILYSWDENKVSQMTRDEAECQTVYAEWDNYMKRSISKEGNTWNRKQ